MEAGKCSPLLYRLLCFEHPWSQASKRNTQVRKTWSCLSHAEKLPG
jgi:hypothetical protein